MPIYAFYTNFSTPLNWYHNALYKNLHFSVCLIDLWEKQRRSRYRSDFSENLLGSGYGLSSNTKICPQLDPFHTLVAWKTWKVPKNQIFHFKIIKHCCDIFKINNFQWQSCLSICFDGIGEIFFKINAYLWNLLWFQCTLYWLIYVPCFKLYLQNDCINIYVWYTVRQGIISSKLR